VLRAGQGAAGSGVPDIRVEQMHLFLSAVHSCAAVTHCRAVQRLHTAEQTCSSLQQPEYAEMCRAVQQ
jgi:hypothetical protein